MTTTIRPSAAQVRRVSHLQQLLGAAIEEAACSWPETVIALWTVLAVVIDAEPDAAVRIGVAEHVAGKLARGAQAPGTFGNAEWLQ